MTRSSSPLRPHFNRRDGDCDGRRARGRGADDAQVQLDFEALAAAVTPRTRAIVTCAEQSDRGGSIRRPPCGPSMRSAGSEASSTCTTRPTSTSSMAGPAISPPEPCRKLPDTRSRSTRCPRLTAWRKLRIGYMVIPESLSDAVNKIQDTLLICPPAVVAAGGDRRPGVGRLMPTRTLARLDATRRTDLRRAARGQRPL